MILYIYLISEKDCKIISQLRTVNRTRSTNTEDQYFTSDSFRPSASMFDILDKIRHCVAFVMEITNNSDFDMTHPVCCPEGGLIQQQPRDIPKGTSGYYYLILKGFDFISKLLIHPKPKKKD